MLRDIPSVLWTAADRILTAVGIVMMLALATNRSWAAELSSTWSGVSPAWTFLPLGILMSYGFMRASFERLAGVQAERDAALARLAAATNESSRRSSIKHELGALLSEASQLGSSSREVDDWSTRVVERLRALLDEGEAQRFLSDPERSGRHEPSANPVAARARWRRDRLRDLIDRVDHVALPPATSVQGQGDEIDG